MTETAYLNDQLITYIGNKRKLIPEILKFVALAKEKTGRQRLRSADLFSGSGIVARHLMLHSDVVVAVDLEKYSKVINDCFLLTNRNIPMEVLYALYLGRISSRIDAQLAQREVQGERGFFERNYAPADIDNIQPGERCFYTSRNAAYLDAVQNVLATTFPTNKEYPAHDHTNKSNEWLYNFFMAPLLSAASVHCNTCGVFKGFYKDKTTGIGKFGGAGENALERITDDIDLEFPLVWQWEKLIHNTQGIAVQSDVNSWVRGNYLNFDFTYIDPPYNQHPYGSNYFMLNFLADKEQKHLELQDEDFSKQSGIPSNWNRSGYNKKKYSKELLFEVLEKARSRFVCLSYNSTGFISYDEIVDELRTLGSLEIKEISYPSFRGSRNYNQDNKKVTEFLFLLDKGANF